MKTNQPKNMLYNGNPEIGLSEIASINSALLTTCDAVFINNNHRVRSDNAHVFEHVSEILEKYHASGLVSYWDYPTSPAQCDIILPNNDYFYWHSKIESSLKAQPLVSLYNYLEHNQFDSPQESASMMVDVKKEYWHYAICNMLRADQIMHMPLAKSIPVSGMHPMRSFRYAAIEKPLVDKLFELSDVNVDGLGMLQYSDMKRLRRSSKDFREFIKRNQESHDASEDDIVYFNKHLNDFVHSLFQQYVSLRPSKPKSVFNQILNIVGFCTLPEGIGLAINAYAVGDGLVDDLLSKTFNDKSMLYFMTKLSNKTKRAEKQFS